MGHLGTCKTQSVTDERRAKETILWTVKCSKLSLVDESCLHFPKLLCSSLPVYLKNTI